MDVGIPDRGQGGSKALRWDCPQCVGETTKHRVHEGKGSPQEPFPEGPPRSLAGFGLVLTDFAE